MQVYKTDKKGRSTKQFARSRDRKKALEWPDEPFVQFGLSFLASPAFKVLSAAAVQVFWRLNIEHMEHGGRDNGKLPCTYSDFEKYGVRRKSISKALDELEALGFIETIRKGHLRPEGDSGSPSLYRITCRHVYRSDGFDVPTNEWRRFDSVVSAKQAISAHHQKASSERLERYHKRFGSRLKASPAKVFS